MMMSKAQVNNLNTFLKCNVSVKKINVGKSEGV